MTDQDQKNENPLVLGLLIIATVFGLLQMFQTVKAEFSRPMPHWANPYFDDLAKHLEQEDSVIFMTDEEGFKDANGRIHTCQYAIIPTRLDVKTDWPSAFKKLDSGSWCICDAAFASSIDDAERKITVWSEKDGRILTFKRFGDKLALFRSLPPTRDKSK